jgi:hypothetical protein
MNAKKPGRFATVLTVFLAFAAPAGAQIQSDGDALPPVEESYRPGDFRPNIWLGVKSIFSAGYNIENGASGFRNLGGSDDTWAMFIIGFVNSRNTYKTFELPENIDEDTWNAKFKLMNFTERIASNWTQLRGPSWLAEIAGKGFHLGFFTQAGEMIGSMDDEVNNNNPRLSIAGGDMVLPLGGTGDNDLGEMFYEKDDASNKTKYTTVDGAIWYTGYEKRDTFKTYLTLLSEGNVNSDTKGGANDGFAGVIDFEITPMGSITDELNPFGINLSGNVIGGVKWEETTENIGYGLKLETPVYLGRENFVLTPIAAFDGKYAADKVFTWKAGGGLNLQFSGKIFDKDEWGVRRTLTNQGFRWGSDNVWHYAYAQAYAAYSEKTDLDLVFLLEEPDGVMGASRKLGAMLEYRLYNVTEKEKEMSWIVQGRLAYDIESKGYLFTPYVRSYFDSDKVLKLRLGAHANLIPNAGFELSYTSANLNPNANTTQKPGGLAFYDGITDMGRIEFTVILQSGERRPQTPKRQDFWNYTKYAPGFTGSN